MRTAPASCSFGRKQGATDTGQRFKVTYRDGLGRLNTFGYAETREGAAVYVKAIRDHSVWRSPKVIDRKPELST